MRNRLGTSAGARAADFFGATFATTFFVAAFFAGARFAVAFFADFFATFRFVAILHLVVQYGVL
jgi:hypothetical protein